MSVSLITDSFSQYHSLYAPTYIYLHQLPIDNYSPLKKLRPIRPAIAPDALQSPGGKELTLEIEYIDSWLRRTEEENEVKRRKLQEEEDAETARLLNYEEYEAKGGLLEW
jgi:hypothetical protein